MIDNEFEEMKKKTMDKLMQLRCYVDEDFQKLKQAKNYLDMIIIMGESKIMTWNVDELLQFKRDRENDN